MIGLMIVLVAFGLVVHVEESVCDRGLEALLEAAVSEARQHILDDAGDELVFAFDPAWETAYDAFSGAVLDFANTCPDADLSYEGAFPADTRLRNSPDEIVPSVAALDINLDGSDEWLLRLDIAKTTERWNSYSFVGIIVPAVAQNTDASWILEQLWPADELAAANRFGRLQGLMVYPKADIHNRTYMALPFFPGIGDDPYVGGMLVLRWDGFAPEAVLVIEQECVFMNWQVGSDGQLYMPRGYTVPWQGCTIPNEIPEQGIAIPGAQMK